MTTYGTRENDPPMTEVQRPLGPDPSVLSTQALAREIADVKDIITREVKHHKDQVDQEFIALGKLREQSSESRNREMDLLHKTLDERQEAQSQAIQAALVSRAGEVEAASLTTGRLVESLAHTTDEKFRSVEKQLEVVERQRVEQKKDTKDAVDAALIAQKEAVQEQTIASGLSIAKSEAATAKQLDQQSVTFQTAFNGLNSTNNDLKDRISKIESSIASLIQVQITTANTKQDRRADDTEKRGGQSNLVGIVGGAVGVLGFLFVIIDRLVTGA